MDDSATGLLPGLYAALQANSYSKAIHRAVPYPELANPLVAKAVRSGNREKVSGELAGQHEVECALTQRADPAVAAAVRSFALRPRRTGLTTRGRSARKYVELVQASQFSLCPAGWAATTFRIFDSMALGVCPVILADLWERPKGPKWENLHFCAGETSSATRDDSGRPRE